MPGIEPKFRTVALAAAALVMLAPTAPPSGLELRIENLRNDEGELRVCLTARADFFPDCTDDPAARKQSVPAKEDEIVFRGLAAGHYAVALVHDENGNGKLDKMLGIPREGFGFSRNPPIRLGPPKFDEAGFDVGPGTTRQTVRVRYLL